MDEDVEGKIGKLDQESSEATGHSRPISNGSVRHLRSPKAKRRSGDHLSNVHGLAKDTKHPTNISRQQKKTRDECKTHTLDAVGAGRGLRSSHKTCPSRGMLPPPQLASAERRQRRCSKLCAQRKRSVFGLPGKHTAAVEHRKKTGED
jgi:hypothetical protein